VFVRGDQTSAELPPDRDAALSGTSDFLHELRNRLFAMSALFDVLELRAGDSAEVARYLPHLRLELRRLEQFAETWKSDAGAVEASVPTLPFAELLGGAISSVSETAALREVLVSLVTEPEAGRVARGPGLAGAVFALLLDEAVRHAPQGSHLVVRVAKSGRDEARVELRCDGIFELPAAAFELANAVLTSIGGDLVAARGAHGGTTLTARLVTTP